MQKHFRLDALCLEANNVVSNLLPSPQDIENENKLFLKDKEGLEKQQGIFLSAILQNKIEGIHLCKSMLLPLDLAEEKKEEFENKGKVNFNGASVESFNDYDLVTINNPDFLNAEDNRTLFYKKDISVLARNGFDFETSKRIMNIDKDDYIKIIKLL